MLDVHRPTLQGMQRVVDSRILVTGLHPLVWIYQVQSDDGVHIQPAEDCWGPKKRGLFRTCPRSRAVLDIP